MGINEFRKKGLHLPEVLKDFHDQKDVFKALHKTYSEEKILKEMPNSWVDNHIFTIDFFLWFMALHGYTLQKCKRKLDYKNLEETIKENKKEILCQMVK